MVNAAVAGPRPRPTVYVIEDAHWIDGVSEAMLADFLAAVILGRGHSCIITYRPEYRGRARHMRHGRTTIALEPLDDSQTRRQLSGRAVGSRTGSVTELVERSLPTEPRVIHSSPKRSSGTSPSETYWIGEPRLVSCRLDDPLATYSVPGVLASRHRRAHRPPRPCAAKRTLNAAAVIGSQFDADIACSCLVRSEPSSSAT